MADRKPIPFASTRMHFRCPSSPLSPLPSSFFHLLFLDFFMSIFVYPHDGYKYTSSSFLTDRFSVSCSFLRGSEGGTEDSLLSEQLFNQELLVQDSFHSLHSLVGKRDVCVAQRSCSLRRQILDDHEVRDLRWTDEDWKPETDGGSRRRNGCRLQRPGNQGLRVLLVCVSRPKLASERQAK